MMHSWNCMRRSPRGHPFGTLISPLSGGAVELSAHNSAAATRQHRPVFLLNQFRPEPLRLRYGRWRMNAPAQAPFLQVTQIIYGS